MRLWTIQPYEVWEQVLEHGWADNDPNRHPPCPHNGEIYIPPQYYWLVDQLKSRLPGYTGRLPWWGHCRKPDLREARYRRPQGTRQVRIEVETDHAISFPIWAWNAVYCGQYLALTEQEYTAWHLDLPPHDHVSEVPEPWQSQLVATWTRLFDPALPLRMPHSEGLFTLTKAREAVFERIYKHEVKAVTPFVGACALLARIAPSKARLKHPLGVDIGTNDSPP